MIYQHKGKYNSLIFLLLSFSLSRREYIQDITRWLFIIFLHFVKRFVWYQSVFYQYNYYCDFFCLGPAYCLCICNFHMWVRYFDTRKIIVLCMSLILTHMSYFDFNIILAYHAQSSEPQVISRYSLIFSAFFPVSSYIQVNNTTYQKVSSIS